MPLTDTDLQAISRLVEVVIGEKVPTIVEEQIKKHVGNLPTKEEFYQRMDLLTGEVRDEREENTIQQAKLEDHESRLEKIESKLGLAV